MLSEFHEGSSKRGTKGWNQLEEGGRPGVLLGLSALKLR